MKKILFLTSLFTILSIAGMTAQTNTESSDNQQISVKVDGLACPFCAYGLEKKFKEIEGVSDIEIDIKKGILSFQMTDGKKVSEELIKKQVKDAGFTPKEIIFSNIEEKTEDGKS
jgi:periplasmic mercuric ion binding protein